MKQRRMRLVEYVAHTREITDANRITVTKLEGNRPVQRCRHRQNNNIKIITTP
jgi:hypothetical protein